MIDMTKEELIDLAIRRFSELSLSGPMNWKNAAEIMEMLISVQEAMKKEDKIHQKQIELLEKQLAAKPPIVFNDDGTITLGGEVLEYTPNQNGGDGE